MDKFKIVTREDGMSAVFQSGELVAGWYLSQFSLVLDEVVCYGVTTPVVHVGNGRSMPNTYVLA